MPKPRVPLRSSQQNVLGACWFLRLSFWVHPCRGDGWGRGLLPASISLVGLLQADVSIALWKNGFTVNDEFHSYQDGASQQFLNAVRKG